MERKRKSKSEVVSKKTSPSKRKKTEDNIENNEAPELPLINTLLNKRRAGRVRRICLKNFMCHSFLTVNLDLNCNFIVGRNGSGKSAILTALIVGLGGKARDTNRGSNMKGFIKVGESSASIEITLDNTGPMAYKADDFGDEITIIRSFSSTGHSSYKLKSLHDKLMPSNFKKINKILEILNIYVNNPICILNQDVSRTFLNSNDPNKLYELFMKATNLEFIKTEYKSANTTKQVTETTLKNRKKELTDLGNELKKLLEKINKFESIKKLENKQNDLKVESVWAQIKDLMNDITQQKNKVDSIKTEMENYKKLISSKNASKEALMGSIEEIKQQLMINRNEINDKNNSLKNVLEEKQKIRESILSKKNAFDKCRNYIDRKTDDKAAIEREIKNYSDNQTKRLEIIKEREMRLSEVEEKIKEIRNLIDTAHNDLTHMNNNKEKEEHNLNSISAELSDLTSKIRQTQSKLGILKSQEISSINVYGSDIQKIVDCMENCKEQFKCMPIGPIGSYIKLKDKKWALAVEDFISPSMLSAFCVDNQNDAKILSKIFNDICKNSTKPVIITSKFFHKVHNYSANKVEAPNGCIAMIDALSIKSSVVVNCLIDQLSIEYILLISSNNLARQLMSHISRVPKNCRRGVTVSGDQFYPDPNYRSYSCRLNSPRFLQVSAAELIRTNEQELNNYIEKNKEIQKIKQVIYQKVQKFKNEVNNLKSNISRYEKAFAKLDTEKTNLQSQVIPPETNNSILVEELNEINKSIEQTTVEKEQLILELNNLQAKSDSNIKICKNLTDEIKILEQKCISLLTKVKELEDKINDFNAKSEHNQLQIKEFDQKFKKEQKTLNEMNEFLKNKQSNATPLKHMETNRSLEAVLKQLEEVTEELEAIKASLGDQVAISNEYFKKLSSYKLLHKEAEKIEKCLNNLKNSIIDRVKAFHKLLLYTGTRMQEMFDGVLHIRQFSGTIEINHESKELYLKVFPRIGSNKGSGSVVILSGGEKSFSTVSFIHALWQVMHYPFYFMDEFDVFMDKINRSTVMDILLNHAQANSHLQFVFLTPQDISNIMNRKNINILRMSDPRREKK